MRAKGTEIANHISVTSYNDESIADYTPAASILNQSIPVTIVFDGTKMTFYVDGVKQAENTDTGVSLTDLGENAKIWFGRSFYSPDGYFKGTFDNIKLYNRALKPGEIAGIDTATLTAAIAAANAAKTDIIVSDKNANEVNRGTKFVTAVEMQTLTDAITAAKAAGDSAVTDAQVTDAVNTLNQAVNAFIAVIKTGTYVTPSSGGSSHSGSSSSCSSSSSGSKTETTTQPNGTTVTTETKSDGTVEQKAETTDGVKAEATTDAGGKTTATVVIPEQAAAAEKTVALPIPAVKAEKVATNASVITVSAPAGKTVKVEVPVTNVQPGTIVMLVKPDGTEEIVKTAVPTENGLTLTVTDGAVLKIVDNTKTFADVPVDNWARDAVTFAAARELFNGTSETSFGPNEPMTRAMLVTVLARADGQDTSAGATWYEKGLDWARENDISDGTNPDGNISREQLVSMLYRYAGNPDVTGGTLDAYVDQSTVSDYAGNAMLWATQQGIINGKTATTLDPKGFATRAEVSAILQRYLSK